MILYMILDRGSREPVKTSYKRYSVFNSYRDASIALSAGLKRGERITEEERAALEGNYEIVPFDTNRLPRPHDDVRLDEEMRRTLDMMLETE